MKLWCIKYFAAHVTCWKTSKIPHFLKRMCTPKWQNFNKLILLYTNNNVSLHNFFAEIYVKGIRIKSLQLRNSAEILKTLILIYQMWKWNLWNMTNVEFYIFNLINKKKPLKIFSFTIMHATQQYKIQTFYFYCTTLFKCATQIKLIYLHKAKKWNNQSGLISSQRRCQLSFHQKIQIIVVVHLVSFNPVCIWTSNLLPSSNHVSIRDSFQNLQMSVDVSL